MEDMMKKELEGITVTAADMIEFLEESTERFERCRKVLGREDRETVRRFDEMISQKELVEALIGMPVNLRKDGKVTVGF